MRTFWRCEEQWHQDDGWQIEARVYWREDTTAFYLEVIKQSIAVEFTNDQGEPEATIEEEEYGVYEVTEMEKESAVSPATWHCKPTDTNSLPPNCILIESPRKRTKRVQWASLW